MQKYTLIFILTLFLTGCYENLTNQNGTLATVNGRPILLNTVMALQEIQAPELASLASKKNDSLGLLRTQYGNALSLLIFYEIFLQELENKGVFITDSMVEAQEKIIRADYPEGEFDKYFSEQVVDIEAWRALLRYGIAVKLFKEHIMRHDFVPSLDQVQNYYEKNAQNFILPERVSLYVLSSQEKELLTSLLSISDISTKLIDKSSEEVFDLLTGTLLENLSYDISAKLLKPSPAAPAATVATAAPAVLPLQEPQSPTEHVLNTVETKQLPSEALQNTNEQKTADTDTPASTSIESATNSTAQNTKEELSPPLSMVAEQKDVKTPTSSIKEKIESVSETGVEQKEEPIVITQYKITVEAEKLPKEWQSPLKSLKENACSDIFKQGENYVRVCLEEKFSKQQLPISEAYIYIEDFLAEENWEKTIHAWLEEALPKADIRVSTHLKDNL